MAGFRIYGKSKGVAAAAMNRREPIAERKKRLIWYACGLAALIAVLALAYSYGRILENREAEKAQTRGDLIGRFEEPRTIEFEGETYSYRKNLTTILLMGVDRASEAAGIGLGARNGGQADFIMLLVADGDRRLVTPIQIDRDTISKIPVLDVLGNQRGTRVTQICLSHGFGDGKEQSCEFTRQAVSWLMMDVGIDYYVAFDISSIAGINDAAGGITVTLEDDYSDFDPVMKKGTTLTLHGKQAELYTRWRMQVGDGTNESRMRRQRTYLTKLADTLRGKLSDDVSFFNTFYDRIESHLTTDMKRGRMINEANRLTKFQQADIQSPTGTRSIGTDGFMEFHADKDSLERLVVDTFYEAGDKS